MNPSGQVHSGRWLITRQLAYRPQGFSSAHGLIHRVSRQAVYKGQSSSEVQPATTLGDVGSGARIIEITLVVITKFNLNYKIFSTSYCFILTWITLAVGISCEA